MGLNAAIFPVRLRATLENSPNRSRLYSSAFHPWLFRRRFLHELAITQRLVEIAADHARQNHGCRVLAVSVEIGTLSGVVAEAVEFCFEACTLGTCLEGARLHIQRIDGRGRCQACGIDVPIDHLTLACPACGSFALERLRGEELRITELEVE